MEERKILSSIVDTLTGKPVYMITVKVKWQPEPIAVRRTFLDKLLRKPLPEQPPMEPYRTFEFWPCIVANQYRIAAKAYLLPNEVFDDTDLLLPLVPEHLPTMVYIIAAAIQNNHLEPDSELMTFIERNFDNIEIVNALTASFQNLNMASFFNSIVLMKGTVNILKASPNDGSELIASPTVS